MADVERIPLDDIRPAPGNVKSHDLELIIASLRRFGFADPLVVDQRTGELLAGHGRAEALRILRALADNDETDPETGEAYGPPDGIDDDWKVPVYVGWASEDDSEAEAARIALNRTTEAGGWDEVRLLDALDRLSDDGGLVGVGYDDDEIDKLRERLDAMDDDQPGDPLPVNLPEERVSVPGDIWTVGAHRIACGDARDATLLDRLLDGIEVGCVLTDPPYGIDLDTEAIAQITGSRKLRHGIQSRSYVRVAGDAEPFDATPIRERFAGVEEQFWFGANYYRRTLSPSDLDGSWLVWDKRPAAWTEGSEGLDDVFGSAFELIWSAVPHQQRVLRKQWSGFTAHNPDHERVHATEKPIDLLADILNRWAPDGCVVADTYAGSGTTAIAAHRTGRASVSVEIDPVYVDVIVARMQAETGEVAVDADGVPFDERPTEPAESTAGV